MLLAVAGYCWMLLDAGCCHTDVTGMWVIMNYFNNCIENNLWERRTERWLPPCMFEKNVHT